MAGDQEIHKPKATFGIVQRFPPWKDLFGERNDLVLPKRKAIGRRGRKRERQVQANSQLHTFTDSRNAKQMLCRKINHCPGSISISLWRIGFLRSRRITQQVTENCIHIITHPKERPFWVAWSPVSTSFSLLSGSQHSSESMLSCLFN